MKVKVITRILCGIIVLVALSMGSCSISPTTAVIIILDAKNNQVKTPGIMITTNYGNGQKILMQTTATGTASLSLQGMTYPAVITASDGIHTFSKAQLQSAPTANNTQIVINELATNVTAAP